MNTISEMETLQILSYLQKERGLLVPTYLMREELNEIMGKELTDDQWNTECDNICDVFGEVLYENLTDELSEQFSTDLEN